MFMSVENDNILSGQWSYITLILVSGETQQWRNTIFIKISGDIQYSSMSVERYNVHLGQWRVRSVER